MKTTRDQSVKSRCFASHVIGDSEHRIECHQMTRCPAIVSSPAQVLTSAGMSASSTPNVTFLEPTFKRAAIVWWAWFWRTLLLSMAATLLIGLAEGVVLSFAGAPSVVLQFLPIVSGAIAGVPVAIYVLQVILRKNFKEFTICLNPMKVSVTQPDDPI
jgi:hypothetical protein